MPAKPIHWLRSNESRDGVRTLTQYASFEAIVQEHFLGGAASRDVKYIVASDDVVDGFWTWDFAQHRVIAIEPEVIHRKIIERMILIGNAVALRRLSLMADESIRVLVATRSRSHVSDILNRMSKDSEPSVRVAVAKNDATRLDVLVKMMSDVDAQVSTAATVSYRSRFVAGADE